MLSVSVICKLLVFLTRDAGGGLRGHRGTENVQLGEPGRPPDSSLSVSIAARPMGTRNVTLLRETLKVFPE